MPCGQWWAARPPEFFAFFQTGLKADPYLEMLVLSKFFKWYIIQASIGAVNTTHLPLPGKPQTPSAATQQSTMWDVISLLFDQNCLPRGFAAPVAYFEQRKELYAKMFSHSSWSSSVWKDTRFFHVDSLPSQDLQGLRNLPYEVIGERSVGKPKVKLQAQQQSHKKGWKAVKQLEQLSWKMWNAERRKTSGLVSSVFLMRMRGEK